MGSWQLTTPERRLTRMEMHQAREEEMVDSYNAGVSSRSWADTNLLAGHAVALEHLHALYSRFHNRIDTSSGAYEGTSLMIPCNGVKRVSVPKGWAGG